MEFQFLGTASGTPSKTRNVSGLALRASGSGDWSLIDCGEGTQHQILRTPLSLHALRAVFITHMHGDHCYGLPGLLASAGMLNRSPPLSLVGPPGLRQFVEGVMAASQLGLPYALEFIDVRELAGAGVLPDLAVHATALSHRIPSWAYGFTERSVERHLDGERLRAAGLEPGPAWGRLQRGETVILEDGRTLRPDDFLLAPRPPRKLIVAGDNDRPDLLVEEARTAHVLVHEATYTEPVLRKVGPAPQHSSAAMTARAASEAGVPNLVLTHFSPRYQDTARKEGDGLSMLDLENEARAAYRGRLFLARDFERYVLDAQGVLARPPGAEIVDNARHDAKTR